MDSEDRWRARLARLRLMDDEFMTKCFEDVECVELVLRIVLEMADLRVVDVRTQDEIKNLQGRSARLDIFAEDSAGKQYNIEVQREDRGAHALRARYNSSLLDANALMPGEDINNLKESYVIFITEHDVIGAGAAMYHADRIFRETGRPLGDGSHIIYVNGEFRDDSPVGWLMHDFMCPDPKKMHFKTLADRAYYFKYDEKGAKEMSSVMREIVDEAVEEATTERLAKAVRALVEETGWTWDRACDILGVTQEERNGLRSTSMPS